MDGMEMLAVIEEIAAGAEGLIRNWDLLPNAERALAEGGPEGLIQFYRSCIEDSGSRAMWIRATLRAHGKKTLESEFHRFLESCPSAT